MHNTLQGHRKVWKSKVPVLFGGNNLSPLVEIELTMAPPAPKGTTPLHYYVPYWIFRPCDGPVDAQIGLVKFPKKNSCRGNYMRKYGTWNDWKFNVNLCYNLFGPKIWKLLLVTLNKIWQYWCSIHSLNIAWFWYHSSFWGVCVN